MIQYPLIDTFEPATQQCDAITVRPLARHCLIKPPPARRQVDQGPAPACALHGLFNCIAKNIRPQHHAGAAPCGRVIHVAMFANAEVTQIGGFQLPLAIAQGAAGQTFAQNTGESIREQRDDARCPDASKAWIVLHQLLRFEAGPDRQAAVGLGLWFGCIAHAALLP